MNKEPASQKIMRWKLAVQDYKCDVVYLPGEENVMADCMSTTMRAEGPSERGDTTQYRHAIPERTQQFKGDDGMGSAVRNRHRRVRRGGILGERRTRSSDGMQPKGEQNQAESG
jgi:hypothetical protein